MSETAITVEAGKCYTITEKLMSASEAGTASFITDGGITVVPRVMGRTGSGYNVIFYARPVKRRRLVWCHRCGNQFDPRDMRGDVCRWCAEDDEDRREPWKR